MPIVVPPADFAPRAAAAITSPRPPHTTVAPRSASSRPTTSARSSWSRPLPITATCVAIHAIVRPVAERQALGGTLVLGGGFAGGYVARLLGKRGATIVSPEDLDRKSGVEGKSGDS